MSAALLKLFCDSECMSAFCETSEPSLRNNLSDMPKIFSENFAIWLTKIFLVCSAHHYLTTCHTDKQTDRQSP